ncbi:helix-turn-helix transcriptional regulator [Paraclostridium bifermentans]|uniref:helix-turn-helix transcriptional regulator n=2 Tax=Paraclostridium bifermentans TaxID=1490 RepID=UPI00291568F0|nr:helix-turn-helix transcriptional regulator [Paraclostridium bifermentans]MDU3338248.1 helix-turn-helix transcriptional regulator [Paraclostridium bifermentans]
MAEYISYLKKYRLLAELTQEELAEKVNVRRETIIRLESAKYNPSLKLAIEISRVLNTPIEEIFVFGEF